MSCGGAVAKECDVWRPAGIHQELVGLQSVIIWKKVAVLW